jgi:hypothetical protein
VIVSEQLVNNEIPKQQVLEEARYLDTHCATCGFTIPEYLVQCSGCSNYYCHRRSTPPAHLACSDVTDAADGSEHAPSRGDLDDPDDFPLEEACIAFDFYSDDDARPSEQAAKESFVCADCWDHKSCGMYPVSANSPLTLP